MLTRPQLVNVGGVIAISLAVTHGLGRRESKLTEAQVSKAGQVRRMCLAVRSSCRWLAACLT